MNWNYGNIDEQALIDFENARRAYLGLPEKKKKHEHYFELRIEDESKDYGFQVDHIVATCKCGEELDNSEIERLINSNGG